MAEFKLPELGEDIEEADVLKLLVAEGDVVTKDQPLIEIETEKATVEVPAEEAGTVTKLHVKAGDTIKVGQLIATIEAGAAAEAPAGEEKEPAKKAPAKAKVEEPEEEASEEEAPEEPEETADEEWPAEETADDEPEAEPEPEAKKPAPAKKAAERKPVASASAPVISTSDKPAFASPSLRKLAREIGVDLSTVEGSGPGGRITEDNVKLASRERAATAPAQTASSDSAQAAPVARPLPDFSKWGKVTREPLTRLRRTVSRNMAQSWTEIPHVHLQHHADITAMEELRQQYKDRAKSAGGNLTISVMMLKIVASALRAHPRVNASYDAESQELILKDYVHIGVAVDTDRGLVVPKIENADEKNIIELSAELNEIAERARTNALTIEEMRGSTFTVTNLGSLGTGYFAPIINWPEVAVLGLGRAQQTAVWDDEDKKFEPRLIMPLSLGHDHRVLDGADGARFMSWIVEAIRNPLLMALEG
ncbi:MAG: dihydrolipoamide acetyltransferase family protein [Chloroflexota bacterium]